MIDRNIESAPFDMTVSLLRWQSLWNALGAPDPDIALFDRLINNYSAPQRAYHSLQHLQECLVHLDGAIAITRHPAEIELALWFHDAIYVVSNKDNEEQSADWARASALAGGLTPEIADRIHELILATRHTASPCSADAQTLVDIDLAILGATPARFDEYEQQIRQEYAQTPGLLYRYGRKRVLQAFAARQHIYHTAHFRASHEALARDNLARALARL